MLHASHEGIQPGRQTISTHTISACFIPICHFHLVTPLLYIDSMELIEAATMPPKSAHKAYTFPMGLTQKSIDTSATTPTHPYVFALR